MNAPDTTFRRNFIVASVMHVVLIGGIVAWEQLTPQSHDLAPAFVDLVVPAALLGDLPKGPGYGTGAFKAPSEPQPPMPATPPPAAPPSAGGPSEGAAPPDETLAPPTPAPTPKAVVAHAPAHDPNDFLIPKNTAATKKLPTAKSSNVENTSDNAKSKLTAKSNKSSTVAKSANSSAHTTGTGTSRVAGPSAADIRARFSRALAMSGSGDGTPYGDGRTAGGGTGENKYGHLGHPDGTVDGVVGGIGQGSPHWRYYEHVHDKMYEAWEQPAQLADRKLATVVLIRVARDGNIVEATVKRSSGNKEMDKSALAAVNKVQRLDPPPAALVKDSVAVITINFAPEG